MVHTRELYSDNEYVIMSEIADNELITQRELSKKLGISVSTVNILINKMVKEGLIKMSQVTQRQVIYMLTPIGMIEKANKTVRYLKGHYRIIYETKEKVKLTFEELFREYKHIILWISDDDMRDILKVAVDEFKRDNHNSSIKFVNKIESLYLIDKSNTVLVHLIDEDEDVIINVVETGMGTYSLYDVL